MAKPIGWSTPESHLGHALAWERIRLPVLEHRATWSAEWDVEAAKCRAAIDIYQGRLQALGVEIDG